MKKTFQNKVEISATPQKVWEIVGDLTSVHKWLAGIAEGSSCSNNNTKRVCPLADGGELKEDIRDYSDDKMTYTYEVTESPFPITNYIGKFTVEANGTGSIVVWDSEFVIPEGVNENEIVPMFEGAYKMSLEQLKSLF